MTSQQTEHEQRPVGFGFAGSVSPACSSSSRRSPQPSATSCWRPRPRRRLVHRRPRPRRPRAPTALAASPRPRSEHRGALGEADGAVPDGTTVFDDEIPGVANLDPALLGALRQAATDAADDGVEFFVDSGWRSPEYQEQLLQRGGLEVRLGRGSCPLGGHPQHVCSRVGGRGRHRAAPMPRRGCPSTAPRTGCARSTATSPGTTNCAPKPSITVARPCTPTRRTIRGCSSDRQRCRGRQARSAGLGSRRPLVRGERVRLGSLHAARHRASYELDRADDDSVASVREPARPSTRRCVVVAGPPQR